MLQTKKPQLEPAIIVIFGLTGDLAQRKLLPALYYLVKQKLLDKDTVIVGISRRQVTADEVLENLTATLKDEHETCDPATRRKLHSLINMHRMDLTAGEDYDGLRNYLDDIEERSGVHMNRLYYLSIPPQTFGPVVKNLGTHGLNSSCRHGVAMTRLLIEKPFGYDLTSARDLIGEINEYFGETQIFRIDHYLAKETVQNILTFRLSNPLFNSLWSREHISHIQISAAEKLDIEGRAIFYEQTGALRDIIQSHLLQLLAVLAMERPVNQSADALHAAKLQLLQDIPPVPADKIWQRSVRGQYTGYTEEVNNPKSRIETYAAVQLEIDNPRWRGVPILLRTGKALSAKFTELSVVFKPAGGAGHANVLTFHIQPDEGISVKLEAKKPGFEYETETVTMNFSYAQTFQDHGHPNAYERVLVDAVRGDHTLFATSETVLAAWQIVEPLVQAWSATADHLESYSRGSHGPAAAIVLAEQTGRPWLR